MAKEPAGYSSTEKRSYNVGPIADLDHSALSGTPNGTLVDHTATYSESATEENVKELAVKLNQALQALRDAGIVEPS